MSFEPPRNVSAGSERHYAMTLSCEHRCTTALIVQLQRLLCAVLLQHAIDDVVRFFCCWIVGSGCGYFHLLVLGFCGGVAATQ